MPSQVKVLGSNTCKKTTPIMNYDDNTTITIKFILDELKHS